MTDLSIAENWLPVVGHEGKYEVSDAGRIRSLPRKRWQGKVYCLVNGTELKPGRCKSGHTTVSICGVSAYVHRMVLEAFVGECPPGMECCHWDGRPSNNRLDNLRWDTRKSNRADQLRHGTLPRGEKNAHAKVTEAQISQIRDLCERSDLTRKEVGRMYGISGKSVSDIHLRKTWSWL